MQSSKKEYYNVLHIQYPRWFWVQLEADRHTHETINAVVNCNPLNKYMDPIKKTSTIITGLRDLGMRNSFDERPVRVEMKNSH